MVVGETGRLREEWGDGGRDKDEVAGIERR